MTGPTLEVVTVARRRRTGPLVVALVLLATGCAGGGDPAPARPAPELSAELVQLRRDEVLQRVEVAVTNRARVPVRIGTVELRVAGYAGAGPQPKDEPLPPGQVVNLPTPYGEVDCPATGEVQVGEPRVVVEVRREAATRWYSVELVPADPRGLVAGIARATCRTLALSREVSLSFGPWRETGSGDDTVLHGALVARLLGDAPYDVTQLAGSVLFDLLPAEPDTQPLARLTPARRTVRVPVLLRQARCDGHARGEIKKPYAFLVWVGPPGGAQEALNPSIADADAAAFESVCNLGWHP